MQTVGNLIWYSTPNAYGPVFVQDVNFGTDQLWRFFLKGGYLDKLQSAAVVNVDNSLNSQNVTVTMNGVDVLVSGGTSSNVPVPRGAITLDITASVGVCTLNFFGDPRDAPPDTPNYNIIVAAAIAGAKISNGQIRGNIAAGVMTFGQYDGNQLIINNVAQSVPPLGFIVAAPGGPAALYYIYAFMNGAVMAGEASATGYQVDPNSGVKVKNADTTRTLIGMGYTTGAGAWALLNNYYNRLSTAFSSALTATVGPLTATAAALEVSNTLRISFLAWAEDAVEISANMFLGFIGSSAINSWCGLGIDSGTAFTDDAAAMQTDNASLGNAFYTCSFTQHARYAEGFHFATIVYRATTAVLSFYGDVASPRSTLKVRVQA